MLCEGERGTIINSFIKGIMAWKQITEGKIIRMYEAETPQTER